MGKIKLLYIVSGIHYSLGFDWLDQHLDHAKYDVSYLFLNPTVPELHHLFSDRKREVAFINLRSKKDYPLALLKLITAIRRKKPDIVHCHLFEANLLGLLSARISGVKKRMYTRHHSTFHFDYAPHMVKYDRMINNWATHIISISDNVSFVLEKKEFVKKEKIHLVHHGFVFDDFFKTNQKQLEEMKTRYNPENKSPVIGVISRFTEWKGIHYIIPAFEELLKSYPGAYLILANAKGDYSKVIDEKLNHLPAHSYQKIVFEKDISTLYKLFNIFVHVPVDEAAEAYGQTYVEALAAGIPSVFTLSGVAREFIVDEQNALVVPFKDEEAILRAMKRLLSDDRLRAKIIEVGKAEVSVRFPIEVMMNALYKVYES